MGGGIVQQTAGSHPHGSWLHFTRHVPPNADPGPFFMKNVAASFLYLTHGSTIARRICRGKEEPANGEAGAIRMHSADGEEHVLLGRAGSQGMRFTALIVPPAHIRDIAYEEGLSSLPDLHVATWPNDVTLQHCLRVLTSAGVDDAADHDEAARSLVLRVATLMGGRPPEWLADECGFSARQLAHLVAYIDAHLRIAPTAADMAALCGLSPGHFARKFRHTTGLSLHRFVNERRIQAALGLLQDPSQPLAHAAIDLGFSSQSHFTRLFGGMTGMSPAKYRRQFRPTVG